MNLNNEPFEPITKEQARALLRVSIRTLDYWVQLGELPAPVKIGRRCYWHPDVFYPWLAIRMNQSVPETTVPSIEVGKPVAQMVMHKEEAQSSAQTSSPVTTPSTNRRFRQPSTNLAIKRQQERIKSLNNAP